MWHPQSSIYAYQYGVYFSHRKSVGFRKYPKNHIRMNGMYGEVTGRPYYPRKMIRNKEEYANVSDFIDGYFKKISQFCLLSSGKYGVNAIKNIFTEELKSIPGRSPLEKFDLHYLFFRAGLHCSETWRNYIKGPEWGPLQSEKLFVAKYASFEKQHLPKVQIDLIKKLNNQILTIPFGSDQDNIDYSEIENQEPLHISSIGHSLLNKNMIEKWNKNEEAKKSNCEKIDYKLQDWKSKEDLPLLINPQYDEEKSSPIHYEEKEMLRFVSKNTDKLFTEEVILPLLTYVDSNDLTARDIQLKNKLISTCAMIKFVELSKQQ